jgi:hypothetical protein
MATKTITKTLKRSGVPTNAYTATITVTRNDTTAAVVAAGTAMTNPSTGTYYTTFTEPAAGLTYTYIIIFTLTAGGTPITVTGTAVGATEAGTTTATLEAMPYGQRLKPSTYKSPGANLHVYPFLIPWDQEEALTPTIGDAHSTNTTWTVVNVHPIREKGSQEMILKVTYLERIASGSGL